MGRTMPWPTDPPNMGNAEEGIPDRSSVKPLERGVERKSTCMNAADKVSPMRLLPVCVAANGLWAAP